jgi:hypothetical protein
LDLYEQRVATSAIEQVARDGRAQRDRVVVFSTRGPVAQDDPTVE